MVGVALRCYLTEVCARVNFLVSLLDYRYAEASFIITEMLERSLA